MSGWLPPGVTDTDIDNACPHDLDAPSSEAELKEHFAAMAEQTIRNEFLWLVNNGYCGTARDLLIEINLGLKLKERLGG